MKHTSLFLLILAITLGVASGAQAHSSCSSALTADQLHELDLMLLPAHPFSAHLNVAMDAEAAQGAVRRLTRADIERLRGAIARPYVGSVANVRPEQDTALKAWFRLNPVALFPAWDATAAISDMPSVWVPREWIGQTANSFVQLVKVSGNVGPIKAATLGSSTTRGRTLGVTQHIAADSAGHDMFLWSYIYRATVDGRLITTLLGICQADVVTMSGDEHDLRALEQQLARAWSMRDRVTIERILARDWQVTTPARTTLSRAAVTDAMFDSNALIVETMTTDDDAVTVTLFDSAAVVRGHTSATVVVSGIRQTNTVRFTDTFIKRDGRWQIVASHQTSVVP
jgi:hypothetical protein